MRENVEGRGGGDRESNLGKMLSHFLHGYMDNVVEWCRGVGFSIRGERGGRVWGITYQFNTLEPYLNRVVSKVESLLS